jgi:uncharacterized protein involved in tellurium resistance
MHPTTADGSKVSRYRWNTAAAVEHRIQVEMDLNWGSALALGFAQGIFSEGPVYRDVDIGDISSHRDGARGASGCI